MLNVFRRHEKHCRHKHKGRQWIRCSCPVHYDWARRGAKRLRGPMETRDWGVADEKRREWEKAGRPTRGKAGTRQTLEAAFEGFRTDRLWGDNRKDHRKLSPPTKRKDDLLFRRLGDFASRRAIVYIDEISRHDLREFTLELNEYQSANTQASDPFPKLKAFFGFCKEAEWVKNPAKRLRPPAKKKVDPQVFEPEQMPAVLTAATDLRDFALTVLMRYSGLAIQDASCCPKPALNGNILSTKRAKSDVPVDLPLPGWVVAVLNSVPSESAGYWFWTQRSSEESNAKRWGNRLKKVFKKAGLDHAHPHMLRDTFAAEWLEKKKPIEQLSVLLGHSSVKVTAEYYSAWTKGRRSGLIADEIASLSKTRDPLEELFSDRHTGGTRE